MASSLFDFFEIVAEELCSEPSRVITREDLATDNEHAPLFDELKIELGKATTSEAITAAVAALSKHFASKGAVLPFSYEEVSGRVSSLDATYLSFVKEMSNIRSIGKKSQDFELGVLARLRHRATGSLHRVGFPRQTKKKREAFNEHLKGLGFSGKVLLGKDKDGGLDILWTLPLGTFPHRPLVSVQCKNGLYNLQDAHHSVMVCSQSLTEHLGLQVGVHVPCVLFNDYMVSSSLPAKPMGFVPLGLSDLALMQTSISSEAI